MLKHVGHVINTGRRCIVVFREIYNQDGSVMEADNCLVMETDSLPDLVHQDMMRIVEGGPAQSTGNLYEVLTRERLSDGTVALNWLHGSNRLRKYPTNNIMLTPDSNNELRLDKMNRILTLQESGASQQEIENVMVDDTDGAPRTSTSAQTAPPVKETESGILDDSAIAQQRLQQAETFLQEAERLKTEAYELDPSLKPKTRAKRTSTKKAKVAM
jgi:hypothetical protein